MGAGTIDHPLLELERVMSSGWMDPDFVERVRAEWEAGPRTPARLRAALFELLGDGFRGLVPVAIQEVLDPAFEVSCWAVLGVVDDLSALRLDDGSYFLLGDIDPATVTRQMVIFRLADETAEADAAHLREMLDEGREPVWALDPLELLDMGPEADFRAFMAGG